MRKSWFKVFGAVFIAVPISFCFCLNLYGAEEKLPNAEEIIEKNLKAIGGRDAYEKIRNQKTEMTAKIVTMGMDLKLVWYQERPDKNYILADMGVMGKSKSGSDGKMAWEISPFNGTRVLEGKQLANKLLENSFDGPDTWKKMYKSVKTEGVESVNGRACYKLVYVSNTGSIIIRYFDKDSYLEVKNVSEGKNSQGTIKVEQFFEDYKETGGILFPRKTRVNYMGNPLQIITIDSIETNIKIPKGTFDLPEEIKSPSITISFSFSFTLLTVNESFPVRPVNSFHSTVIKTSILIIFKYDMHII
jgi:hypothetical protein